MATTRSKKLGEGRFTDAAGHLIYTVPAGHRTILKTLRLFCVTGSGATASVYYTSEALGANVSLLIDRSFDTDDVLGLDSWYVLDAGDELHAFSNCSDWSIIASGAELPILA